MKTSEEIQRRMARQRNEARYASMRVYADALEEEGGDARGWRWLADKASCGVPMVGNFHEWNRVRLTSYNWYLDMDMLRAAGLRQPDKFGLDAIPCDQLAWLGGQPFLCYRSCFRAEKALAEEWQKLNPRDDS